MSKQKTETDKEPNYYAVVHPMTGDMQKTIIETMMTPSQLRKYVEDGLIKISKATPRELIECAGKIEKIAEAVGGE